MRTRNLGLMAAAAASLLLVSGCGHSPKKDARQAGQNAERQLAARTPAASSKPTVAAVAPTPSTAAPVNCARVKCVALTFDDGPGPYTARLLDTLKAANAHATFFMLGQNVHSFSGAVRRMTQEGHEVANHSWSHPQLTTLPPSAVRSQIKRTQDAIAGASGGVRPTLMRPPYGATNKAVARAVNMPLILWSVDTLDWKYRDTARNIRVGVHDPQRGGIVLFHDIHKTTVDAIPKVLAGLKRRGFTFVTVSEMFRGQPLKPGHTYTEFTPPKPAVAPSSPAPGSPPPSNAPETPGTEPPASPTPSSPPTDTPTGTPEPGTPAPGSPAPESTPTGARPPFAPR